MKLTLLHLQNFKGALDVRLEAPSGEDLAVYGDNATGKTTLFDAWTWLLFGKDSAGASAFELKPLDASGEALHGLDHSVTARLRLDSGKTVELSKVHREVWTKRRGSAERVFSGHTIDHFVGGVPLSKGEFDAAVAQLAGSEDNFRLLTDPSHFAERLHWSDRRRILFGLCGEIGDSEVIESAPELQELSAILGDRSADDHRRVLDARIREINAELARIPVRVDEQTRSKPKLDALPDRARLAADLAALREEFRAAGEERASLAAGGAVAKTTGEVRKIEAAQLDRVNKLRAAHEAAMEAPRSAVAEARRALSDRSLRAGELERRKAACAASIRTLETRMEELRSKWESVNGLLPPEPSETTCSACGQPLPPDAIATAHRNAVERFNVSKAERLERISVEGREAKAQRDLLERDLGALTLQLDALPAEEDLTQALAEAEEAAQMARLSQPQPSLDPEWASLEERRQALAESLASARKLASTALREADQRLDEIARKIANAEVQTALWSKVDAVDTRVEELKAQERDLSEALEQAERERALLDEFVRARVRLVEATVNSKFEMARFRLFKLLINGGLEECCEVTYRGVPYGSGLNHGARIQVGLDIIRTLQRHFKVAPPVFVDQGESVTSLPAMDNQLIRLIVSPSDRALRIERNNEDARPAPPAALTAGPAFGAPVIKPKKAQSKRS